MKTSIVIASLFLGACATTGSTGKGSSAAFPGFDAVQKRREEISKAGSDAATPCLKVKDPGKGGFFSVSADATGKLTGGKVKWEGPDSVAQCVVDAIGKTTVSAMPGTPIGTLIDFWAPGAAPAKQEAPGDMESKMQGLQQTTQAEVDLCGQRFLGEGFPADIEISVFVTADGSVWAPTLVKSTAKDGNYDSCVHDVVSKLKFPQISVENPLPMTLRFHVGRLEKL